MTSILLQVYIKFWLGKINLTLITQRNRRWNYKALAFLCCLASPIAFSLTDEIPDKAELIANRYLADPLQTLTSYAVGEMGGANSPRDCGVTLIGPRTAMGAAHCGFHRASYPVRFRVYRERDPNQVEFETFFCQQLSQTFSNTDLFLLDCPGNPGLKYGYLDFDPTIPKVGSELYSIWDRDVVNQGLVREKLWSPGTISNLSGCGYQGCITMDMVTEVGASGSPHINKRNHRVHIGPLSIGGGNTRYAVTMEQYLFGEFWTEVNASNIAALLPSANSNSYLRAKTDGDQNRVFDIQEDIEQRFGEPQRDHYWLGFESERRNAMWVVDRNTKATFDTDREYVHVDSGTWYRYEKMLTHRKLNLKPDTLYRISLLIHTNRSGGINGNLQWITENKGARFEFGHQAPGPFGPYDVVDDAHVISTVPGSGWQFETFYLRTGRTGDLFARLAKNAQTLDASFSSISIIEAGVDTSSGKPKSIMDFDTADKRRNWRNNFNGLYSHILPDGIGGPGTVDWAGLVQEPNPGSMTTEWPLRNSHLALVSGASYRLCFQYRKYTGQGNFDGQLKVTTKGGTGPTIASLSFNAGASTSWQGMCTDEFRPSDPYNMVHFGITGSGRGPDHLTQSFLVDNVELRLVSKK